MSLSLRFNNAVQLRKLFRSVSCLNEHLRFWREFVKWVGISYKRGVVIALQNYRKITKIVIKQQLYCLNVGVHNK